MHQCMIVYTVVIVVPVGGGGGGFCEAVQHTIHVYDFNQ